ncbi:sericin-2-like [Macrobrachium rosenbergii]|uniref:sericin-2-like n=1 Tax=Macrobrachium rosenbergii TaxID=79674 RepID=UPI0034D5E344
MDTLDGYKEKEIIIQYSNYGLNRARNQRTYIECRGGGRGRAGNVEVDTGPSRERRMGFHCQLEISDVGAKHDRFGRLPKLAFTSGERRERGTCVRDGILEASALPREISSCPGGVTEKVIVFELQFSGKETDSAEVAESNGSANNSGTATTFFADSPADSAASPASCSSGVGKVDSQLVVRGPNDLSSRDTSSSNSSEASASSPSASTSTISNPGTLSTSQESTSPLQGVFASTSTASPFATSAGNVNDGEDEGIADGDSDGGSSNV